MNEAVGIAKEVPMEQPDDIFTTGANVVPHGTKADGRETVLHILMPTRGRIAMETVMYLIHTPVVTARVDIQHYRYWFTARLPVDQSREDCASRALDYAQKHPDFNHWCLWIDDDMLPALGAFGAIYNELKAHPEIGLLSGYAGMKRKFDPAFIYSPVDNHLMTPGVDFQHGEIVEAGWTGMAFMVHRMDVLEKIPRPWFKCHDGQENSGEDNYFTLKARKHGFRVFVHSGVPIMHVDANTGERFMPFTPSKLRTVDTPKPKKAEPSSGLVCGFLTCGMPHLADAMVDQLRGTNLVCLDNGGDPSYAGREGVVVIRNRENRYFSGGFNDLMGDIIRTHPEAEAVWLCNDDITGASPAMAESLFSVLKRTGAAAVSPSIDGCHHTMMQPHSALGLVSVDWIDFCCPMISVAAWREIGPLDSKNFTGWFADVDWCKRARQKDCLLIVDYQHVIKHLEPSQTCIEKGTMELHAGGTQAEERFQAKYGGLHPWEATASAADVWAKATKNGTDNGREVA